MIKTLLSFSPFSFICFCIFCNAVSQKNYSVFILSGFHFILFQIDDDGIEQISLSITLNRCSLNANSQRISKTELILKLKLIEYRLSI